jgi:hypothetical protein
MHQRRRFRRKAGAEKVTRGIPPRRTWAALAAAASTAAGTVFTYYARRLSNVSAMCVSAISLLN